MSDGQRAIQEKSFAFSLRVVKLCKYLRQKKTEYILVNQLLRSGTSIGANVAEAEQAQSKPDFISKMSIALKETTETKYWLKLLCSAEYLSEFEYQSIMKDCVEIEKLLVSIVKASK